MNMAMMRLTGRQMVFAAIGLIACAIAVSSDAKTVPNGQPTVFENYREKPSLELPGVDARWKNFSSYLQNMIEVVQLHWERALAKKPASSSTSKQEIIVRFRLKKDGKISAISVTGDAGNEAKHACVDAVRNGSPYEKWTTNMVATLGSSQEMTFVFYYR